MIDIVCECTFSNGTGQQIKEQQEQHQQHFVQPKLQAAAIEAIN